MSESTHPRRRRERVTQLFTMSSLSSTIITTSRQNNKNKKQQRNTTNNTRRRRVVAPRRLARDTRQRPQRPPAARSRGTLEAYINALRRPFFSPATKLGFGTLTPTSVRTAWARGSVGPTAGAFGTCGDWLVVATPDTNAMTGGNFGNSTGFLTTAAVLGPYTAWSTASTVGPSSTCYASPASNSNTLASLVNTCRVVSMALRVTVRFPMSSARGAVYAGYVPDTTRSLLSNTSPTTLSSLPFMKMCSCSSAGELTCEVQYRPSEISDYTFSPDWIRAITTPIGSSVSVPQLVVMGTGWTPATFSVDIALIAHYECLAGLTSGGNDADDSSLPIDVLTMEQAASAALRAGPSILTSQIIADSIDSFVSNIDRFGRFGTGGGRTVRGLLTQNTIDVLHGPSTFNSNTSSHPSALHDSPPSAAKMCCASSSTDTRPTPDIEDCVTVCEPEYGTQDLSKSTILAFKRMIIAAQP